MSALAGVAALFALGGAQSLTVPDWCGGVRPCPPPCLGAPEVAREPEEFVKLARYELGRPFRRVAPVRWTPRAASQPLPPAMDAAAGPLGRRLAAGQPDHARVAGPQERLRRHSAG